MTQCGFRPIYSSFSHTESRSHHEMSTNNIISMCIYIYIFMSCERKWSQYNKIQCHTSWWFQTFFIVLPLFGEIPILTNIFQMGWNYSFENLHVWSCLTWHPCSAEAFWLLGFAVVYMATVQQEAEQGADFGMVRFWEGLVNPSLETGLGLDINCDFTNFYCMTVCICGC